jgi:hypothetical protein
MDLLDFRVLVYVLRVLSSAVHTRGSYVHLFVFVVLMNAMILVTPCIIPLKALADATFESLNNFKSLLNSAAGFLKAT